MPKDSTLAAKPPMGWNSWNCFRCYDLNEEAVLGIADAMVSSGMRDAGYGYLVVDDCWQALKRDDDGRLSSHRERFPSGMAYLGEQIHARGLKFGLYLAPGRKTCAMIYDHYPAEGIGSFGHEQLDADTIVEWEWTTSNTTGVERTAGPHWTTARLSRQWPTPSNEPAVKSFTASASTAARNPGSGLAPMRTSGGRGRTSDRVGAR